jgi:Sulfite exporter TauE/SafE.
MKILFVLFGILGGVLGGLGMGGGTLLIPLLSEGLNVEQHTAQLINLLAFIPMSLVALSVHIKNKLVVWKGLLYILLPATCTAVIASLLASSFDAVLLKKLFGGFLTLVGTACFFSGFVGKNSYQ